MTSLAYGLNMPYEVQLEHHAATSGTHMSILEPQRSPGQPATRHLLTPGVYMVSLAYNGAAAATLQHVGGGTTNSVSVIAGTAGAPRISAPIKISVQGTTEYLQVVAPSTGGVARATISVIPAPTFNEMTGIAPGGPGGTGGRSLYITPEDFGAKRNGVTDDIDAIENAIAEAMSRAGGTVLLSPGVYAISRPIGSGFDRVSHVYLEGDGDLSAIILCKDNFDLIAGKWTQCTIRNIILDANLQGGAGIRAQFDKVTVEDCLLRGWLGYGMFFNPYDGEIGLLNRIRNNHIVQSTGYGIYTTYLFVDSWLEGNNIGSTEANLSLEAGPIRAIANHLNGAPKYNIELRGNQRVMISENIMEGSRLESLIYNMPPWLSEDHPQIQILGNAISNGGKAAPNTRPAIGIYGLEATKNVYGFNIVGNIIACQDEGSGWTYAVEANHAKDVVAVGNQWRLGFSKTKPVGATASSVLQVSANSGGNDIERK